MAPPPLSRRFTKRYILALCAVALLALGGMLLAGRMLRRYEHDLEVISLAGRQRTLSQEISVAALVLQSSTDPRAITAPRDALRSAIAELHAAHGVLQRGDHGDEIAARLAALDFDIEALRAATADILARSQPPVDPPTLAGPVRALLRHEAPFYARMDEIVALLEREADGHVTTLRMLAYGAVAGILLALLLEGLFVFRPAVARLTHEMVAQSRLQRQLLDAVTAEQHRLGSDLHDGLLQQLTGLSLLIRSQLTRASRGAQIDARDLTQIGNLLDEAIAEARRMSRAMMPVVLEQKGLAYALEDLSKQANASQRARCSARVALRGRLPEPLKSNHLFRIAQEAVQNALKHSRATEVLLELVDTGDALELSVTDDGIGLITPDGSSRSGMGLRTMEYRARAIGAELRLVANRPHGTIVRCRLPDVHIWDPSISDHGGGGGHEERPSG